MTKYKSVCPECQKEIFIPFKGAIVFCDDCSWDYISGGTRQDVVSQDIDSLNEFALRNSIETSDV